MQHIHGKYGLLQLRTGSWKAFLEFHESDILGTIPGKSYTLLIMTRFFWKNLG
jgi:hypothetical protein